MDDTGDLKNKSSVNFREEPFRHRRDKPNSLGKREEENRQQIVSSHYPAQLYGMTQLNYLGIWIKMYLFLRIKNETKAAALPRRVPEQLQIRVGIC